MQDISTRLTHAFLLCSEHDTSKRQLGENELRNLAMEPQYPIILLHYILSPTSNNEECLIRAAIEFKKWILTSWVNCYFFSDIWKDIILIRLNKIFMIFNSLKYIQK